MVSIEKTVIAYVKSHDLNIANNTSYADFAIKLSANFLQTTVGLPKVNNIFSLPGENVEVWIEENAIPTEYKKIRFFMIRQESIVESCSIG